MKDKKQNFWKKLNKSKKLNEFKFACLLIVTPVVLLDFLIVGGKAISASESHVILRGDDNKNYAVFIDRVAGYGIDRKTIKALPVNEDDKEVTFWEFYKRVHNNPFSDTNLLGYSELRNHPKMIENALNNFEENGALTTCEANHMRKNCTQQVSKNVCAI